MEKINIDGKEYTIEELQKRIKELEAGSMMQADYTRKTQELAEERKKVKEMEEMLKAKENELADIIEFATILEENPSLADEIEKIIDKYKDSQGKSPAKGSAEDIAQNKELQELIDKVNRLEEEKRQEKIKNDYERIMNSINSAINETGLEFNDYQKNVLQKASWMAIMEEISKTQKFPEPQEINAKVKEIVENVFPNAKKIKKIENPTGQSRQEIGGNIIRPEDLPHTGTIEYKKKVGEIFKNIFDKYKSGG